MKNNYLLLLVVLFSSSLAYSQLLVNTELFVSNDYTFYTNENIINEGELTLSTNSRFVFDKNYQNDGVANYNDGILAIGSGDATRSSGAQTLLFDDASPEEANFIELNKAGGTATITRGVLYLNDNLTSTSGTLDANSSITDTPSVNTVSGLVFSSDQLNTSYINSSSGGSVENIIVERYIPGGKRAFRAFSSSLNINGTIKENLMEGGQVLTAGTINNPRPGFGTHITGSGVVSDGFDITGTNNPSMFQYTDPDNGAFTSIANTAEDMRTGEAFFLFLRGDRSLDLTSNTLIGTNPFKLRTLGDAVIGSFDAASENTVTTTPSTVSDQIYMMVGNPYQAQVEIAEVLTSTLTTGIDKTQVYVYSPDNGVGAGSYVTLTFNLVGASYVFDTSVPLVTGAEFLQPNQSMFVEKDNTTALVGVQFEEAFKRTSTQNVDIFSDTSNSTEFEVRLDLIENSNNDTRDGILIRFSDNYNSDFNQMEDAVSLVNILETMATESTDGNLLAVDKRNLVPAGEIIPLNITNYQETNYSFSISVNNNNNQEDIYLIDNYLNTETLIDTQNQVITFSVDQNIPGSLDPNRFQLGINTTNLSINNFEGNNLSVYPNPSTNYFNINTADFDQVIDDIEIFDVTGKKVLYQNFSESGQNLLTVNVDGLAGGVYILRLNSNGKQYQTKIIKE
jgi:hypothetical protein